MQHLVAPHLTLHSQPMKEIAQPICMDDKIASVSIADDYVHRHAELQDMPAYLL
jgi:hypothetical protein